MPTKRLNEQVRRNQERFQHSKFLPYAFTEHGAFMAAGVLNSRRAIEVSIHVVRTFVAMREALANTRELAQRLDELERSLNERLAKHDQSIAQILAAIRALMNPPEPPQRSIGFVRSK